MTAPNAATGSIATLPVETGEALVIDILDHDPETCCTHEDGKVATHLLVTPKAACGDHPLCMHHARTQAEWLAHARAEHAGPTVWTCGRHGTEWVGTADEVLVRPIGGDR